MERLPDREGGDGGQAIGGRTQGSFQEFERPGCGAVAFRRGSALHLAEDAGAGGGVVGRPTTAAVTQGQGVHAEFVEASDQGGDGVATLAANGVGRILVVGTVGDG
jgi:hypothetical protein